MPRHGGGASNFGWPCYEGPTRQPGFDATGLTACADLYASPGAVTQPVFSYTHGEPLHPDDTCDPGGSSLSGLAFYGGGAYPATFDGAKPQASIYDA